MLTDFYIAVLNYEVRHLTTHYCLHDVITVSTLLFCSTHNHGSIVFTLHDYKKLTACMCAVHLIL